MRLFTDMARQFGQTLSNCVMLFWTLSFIFSACTFDKMFHSNPNFAVQLRLHYVERLFESFLWHADRIFLDPQLNTVLYILQCVAVSSFCPLGMIYQCGAPACLATCANPSAPQFCLFPNKDACVCPPGQLLFNETCTSNCPIGCLDPRDQLHPVSK